MLILLLSPSVAGFSEVGQRPNVLPGTSMRRTSTGSYTNSDCSTSGKENFALKRELPPILTTTRLQYRDGDHDEVITRRLEHDKAASGWWKSIFSPDPAVPVEAVDSEQAVVDDYLEFLERRYHRLHDNKKGEVKKFSALKWLMQGSEEENETTIAVSANKEEDALYVLGVAGLASQRLLQKHQPVPAFSAAYAAQDRAMAQSAMAMDAVVVPSSRLSVMAAMAVTPLAPVWKRLTRQRQALLRFQTTKMQAAFQLLMRVAVRGPIKATKALVELGGGKHNVAVTLTFTVALAFLLLRPMVQAVISEGSSVRQVY